jgi:hypothetical protein
VTQDNSPTHTFFLKYGLASQYKLETEKPFRNIIIGDPQIVDVKALSDRRFIIYPLAKRGTTNILFTDDANDQLANLAVMINNDDQYYGRVDVVNRPLLQKTWYQCWDKGCIYVDMGKYELPTRVERQTIIQANPGSQNQ